MKEGCVNCKYRKDLVKFDYSQGGCIHTKMDGFVCLLFINEGQVEWMYGTGDYGLCECFTPKDGTE